MKLHRKVLVITGGGGGIGLAMVREALNRGASVFAVDLDVSTLEDLADEVGDRLAFQTLDVADRAAVAALPEQVVDRFGVVDGLINNAGIIHPVVPLDELETETIDRVMHVNFGGTVAMTRAFLPLLKQRREAHIANMSSMVALACTPNQLFYGASKAAIYAFSEGLVSELAGSGVGVTVVIPGVVKSGLIENSGVASQDLIDPRVPQMETAAAAERILDGIERNRFRLLIGADARAFDIIARVSPRLARYLVVRGLEAALSD